MNVAVHLLLCHSGNRSNYGHLFRFTWLEDFATHSAAYFWLRECQPFRRVLDQFRIQDLSVFEVAACLAIGTSRPLTPTALKMLAEEVARQDNGLRDTLPL